MIIKLGTGVRTTDALWLLTMVSTYRLLDIVPETETEIARHETDAGDTIAAAVTSRREAIGTADGEDIVGIATATRVTIVAAVASTKRRRIASIITRSIGAKMAIRATMAIVDGTCIDHTAKRVTAETTRLDGIAMLLTVSGSMMLQATVATEPVESTMTNGVARIATTIRESAVAEVEAIKYKPRVKYALLL
jgi:hypothetical protein